MTRIIETISDRLAARSSRRGFLAKLGQVSAAGVAVIVGIQTESAHAANCPCGGNVCAGNVCPSGTMEDSTQDFCCGSDCHIFSCTPCVTRIGGPATCYVQTGGPFCVCPSRRS